MSDGVLESILASRDRLATYLDEHGDPRTLAGELAELRAQIRYLAEDYESMGVVSGHNVAKNLRALVGPWPHERTETERGGSVGQKADIFVAQPSPIRKDGDPPRSVSGPHEASRGEE